MSKRVEILEAELDKWNAGLKATGRGNYNDLTGAVFDAVLEEVRKGLSDQIIGGTFDVMGFSNFLDELKGEK